MSLTEDTLLHSGFNQRELQLLKNSIETPNGSLDGVVSGFAKRFMVFSSLFLTCLLALTIISLFTPIKEMLLAVGALVIILAVLKWMRFPVIAWKCWFYCSHQWK
ncbi:hypothetical protein [uncultured Pluralibacter sp.]|uniref:hypothetical protein n=1 Tax=uncultured Pluralibacter sp. TaxID=1490864 RepID=UPI0026225385|nr:hypothetical protein [uncultured Pluralibacter sp.]